MPAPARDRFDDVPRTSGRVGAHRAHNPRMNGWVALLWAVVATVILTIVGTFAMLVYTGRIDPFPSGGVTSEPAPEETGVVDTAYSVLILNGTADTGLDARMRDTVVNAGWPGDDVIAGPSGVTDFATTTVYYELDTDRAAALGLAGVIGGAEIVQSDYYANPADPDAHQLVIVIGQDRAATDTTTPAIDE